MQFFAFYKFIYLFSKSIHIHLNNFPYKLPLHFSVYNRIPKSRYIQRIWMIVQLIFLFNFVIDNFFPLLLSTVNDAPFQIVFVCVFFYIKFPYKKCKNYLKIENLLIALDFCVHLTDSMMSSMTGFFQPEIKKIKKKSK